MREMGGVMAKWEVNPGSGRGYDRKWAGFILEKGGAMN